MRAPYLRVRADPHPEPGWNYGLWRSAFFDLTAERGASFGVYNQRLVPLTYGDDRFDGYWALRRRAAMVDVSGERTLEIRGPDAGRLLNQLFTRDIFKMNVGRAAYGLMCYDDGGLLCDGVLLRLGVDVFRYVHASGEVTPWMRALAIGLDVEIIDPEVSALQIQGPRSLDILSDACDGPLEPQLGLFDCARARIGGQPVVVSRTGWTGELGCEVYVDGKEDGAVVWRALEQTGASHGMAIAALDAMDIRRIEAGILNYGSDIDATMTPFEAGLQLFVDLNKPYFIGRDALIRADRSPRICGLTCQAAEPHVGSPVIADGGRVGRVTAAGWSPFLERGVAIVRLDEPMDTAPCRKVTVASHGDAATPAVLTRLPLYDRSRRLARGLTVED